MIPSVKLVPHAMDFRIHGASSLCPLMSVRVVVGTIPVLHDPMFIIPELGSLDLSVQAAGTCMSQATRDTTYHLQDPTFRFSPLRSQASAWMWDANKQTYDCDPHLA